MWFETIILQSNRELNKFVKDTEKFPQWTKSRHHQSCCFSNNLKYPRGCLFGSRQKHCIPFVNTLQNGVALIIFISPWNYQKTYVSDDFRGNRSQIRSNSRNNSDVWWRFLISVLMYFLFNLNTFNISQSNNLLNFIYAIATNVSVI